MKIYLDRTGCGLWDCSCESDFSFHYLREEILPTYCLVKIVDDGRDERTFVVQDRDGTEKTLEVNEGNWAEVHDSWILAWERQQKTG